MFTSENRPYTLREAAAATGVTYHHMWRLVKRGEIKSSRLGDKILIPRHVIDAIVNGDEVNTARGDK